MSRYFTSDGNEFVAASDDDLVEQMRRASFTPSESSAEFMRDVALRLKEESGVVIKTGKPEDFITSLVDLGFLEEKEEKSS